jgi:hypothetical protein
VKCAKGMHSCTVPSDMESEGVVSQSSILGGGSGMPSPSGHSVSSDCEMAGSEAEVGVIVMDSGLRVGGGTML